MTLSVNLINRIVIVTILVIIIAPAGLLGLPLIYTRPSVFKITSSSNSQSSLYIITRDVIQITISTHFGDDDLFITTTVTMKNVGTATARNLNCEYDKISYFCLYQDACYHRNNFNNLNVHRCAISRSG